MKQLEEQKRTIEHHFKKIMEAMGLDLTNDSLMKTPHRVAKMFTYEVFSGLRQDEFPRITLIENEFEYDQMLIERDIDIKSFCEHHFLPIIGKAHIAYIPEKKVIGLSKLNRIAEYYSRRPQVQERLTQNILEKLKEILETDNVAVTIDAIHYCVRMRGIEHTDAITRTSALSGTFKHDQDTRREFFNAIGTINA